MQPVKRETRFWRGVPATSMTGRFRSALQSVRPAKDGWHNFVIDVWLTDFNTTEFGVYKRSRNRAKSRQFTADMDIYAEIIEDGKRTGLLGYRKDLWKDKTGTDRRLVFKMFTDSLNWRATMDLMIGRSLQLTMGARGLPVTAYSINTNDDDFMIYLERSAFKWPILPEHFSFFLMIDGKPEYFRLKRALINIGGDYTLYNQKDEPIGYIDGQILSLAGKWRGRLKQEYNEQEAIDRAQAVFRADHLQPGRALAYVAALARCYRRAASAQARAAGSGSVQEPAAHALKGRLKARRRIDSPQRSPCRVRGFFYESRCYVVP